MPFDPALTGLPQDLQIDGTELLELLASDGRKAAQIADIVRLSGAAIEFATPANLLAWATARSKVRSGEASAARIAVVADSKGVGAGAGTGAQFADGAFPKSRPSRIAAILTGYGLPMRTDFWFGGGGLPSIAAVLAYDTRRTGFNGWSGGVVSLGGAAMWANASVTSPGQFQLSAPVDRCSIFHVSGAATAAFSVAKGSETFNYVPAGAAVFSRTEFAFSTKDASPIVVTRTGGGELNLIGMGAWDSAKAGIEVANFSVYGQTAGYQAGRTNSWSPANALAAYAPHLTEVSLGGNDLNQSVAMETWLANIGIIVAQAKVTGSVILSWHSMGGVSPAYGSDITRAAWRDALRALAQTNGCMFVDYEAMIGGRTAAQAGGAFIDQVHEKAWVYDMQASAVVRAII